jgi:hypothetical protein
MMDERQEHANREAVRRINAADVVWRDVATAGDVLPGFHGRIIGHAGPPITWQRMAAPQRGGIIAAVLFEGWAETPAEAETLLHAGEVELRPNNDLGAVNPMAGIMSPSSAVFVVREERTGKTAVSTLVEGRNPAQRFGNFEPETIARLRWLRETVAPVLGEAVRRAGGVPLTEIAAQAVQMGDELHQRNTAATALLVKRLVPHLVRGTETTHDLRAHVATYLSEGNEQFFLNLGMAMAKATMRTIEGLPDCTLVSAMARNGVELGIKVAGLGDRWFTGPSQVVRGTYFAGFGPDDAQRDIGDSAIMETFGVGYFALACAGPAFPLLGVSSQQTAVEALLAMRRIAAGESERFRVPALDFAPLPLGIDVRKVAETGIPPSISTAIAHKAFGVGRMIGAGLVQAPLEPFVQAAQVCAEMVRLPRQSA